MSGEKNEITRRFWIRKLKVNLVLKNFPSYVHNIELQIAKFATFWGLDLHDACMELLLEGLESYSEKLKTNDDFLNPNGDQAKEIAQLQAVLSARFEISRREQLLNDLLPIFKAYGPEAFEQFCDEHGFDPQEFYDNYEQELQKFSWAKRAKEWVKFEMQRALAPLPVDEVKRRALAAGIVDPDESNWPALVKHAQRLGVTNRPYGYWFSEE